jgi:hypothetical protein
MKTEKNQMVSQYTVIELRRYTIKPGARATFARYFETWFPEAFQQLGAIAFGHFCEREQTNRFTWLRGFRDMNERLTVNQAFYFGPVWAEHKPAVNGLIVDSDDVLLLCPARTDSGVRAMCAVDPVNEPQGAQGIAVAQVFKVRAEMRDAFLLKAEAAFATYRDQGVIEAGVLKTLDVPNNFPQHPIRADGTYLVWLGLLREQRMLDALRPAFDAAAESLAGSGMLDGATELVILDPCRRSRLRWAAEAETVRNASTGD